MYDTLVQMFDEHVKANPDYVAQLSRDGASKFKPVTYIELQRRIRALAAALRRLGVRRNEIIAIISDNRAEWLVADMAILSLGAIDTPRGRDAMDYEIEYILKETKASIAFVENYDMAKRVDALVPSLPSLKTLIIIDERGIDDPDKVASSFTLEILYYKKLLSEGQDLLNDPSVVSDIEHEISLGKGDDTATIIFTSGTTGKPKGVMISHKGILFQLDGMIQYFPDIKPQMIWLAVLPIWHAFERMINYLVLRYDNIIAYSKPIGKIMLVDMATVKPHFMCSVPRIWETVKAGVNQTLKTKKPIERKMFNFFLSVGKSYSKASALVEGRMPDYEKRSRALDFIRGIIPYICLRPLYALGRKLAFSQVLSKLGPNFVLGISGGGTISKDVESFFDAMGLTIMDGYGLTETSPMIAAQDFTHRVRGCLELLKGSEIKIVGEMGESLPPGRKGVLYFKGPQVMKGYFNNPELTAEVIDKDGFINTGDLAVMTESGLFSIRGREKDTIVLSGGENIEPVPIEKALSESEYIETAVVVGQDKKFLSALIAIDVKNVENYLKDMNIPYIDRRSLASSDDVRALINREIQTYVSTKRGFKPFEQVNRFAILTKSFEVGKELSLKQEIKRKDISEMYKKEIDSLFA